MAAFLSPIPSAHQLPNQPRGESISPTQAEGPLTESSLPAHLDRLISREDSRPERKTGLIDSLLEFRTVVCKRPANPEFVVSAFYDLRRDLEPRDYLAAYRIRRTLEQVIQVAVTPQGADAPHSPVFRPLELRWKTLPKLVQSYRRTLFEQTETLLKFDEIRVGFDFC